MNPNQPLFPNTYCQTGTDENYLDQVTIGNSSYSPNQDVQNNFNITRGNTYDQSAPDPLRDVDRLREQFTVCTIYAEDEENQTSLGGPPDNAFSKRADINQENVNAILTAVNPSRPSGSAGDAERRRDAWIPGPRTLRALQEVASGGSGSLPEGEALTMPGVMLDSDLGDPVGEMMAHYLGEAEASKRKVLVADDVTQDDRGLRQLIEAGCLRAAVNLTGRLLSLYGQGRGRAGQPAKHTHHSLQLWYTRLALLVRLRMFGAASDEAAAFDPCLDRPDLYFAFRPELHGDRSGSVAPFALRLLIAELPAYLPSTGSSGGGCERAFDNLFAVLATVEKILLNLRRGLCEDGSQPLLSEDDRNKSLQLWSERRKRVLFSITNCAVYAKDYELAVKTLQPMVEEAEAQGNGRSLRSALGRLLLQLGDVAGAEHHFALARKGSPGTKADEVCELIDRGLVAVAQNAFREALQFFRKALQLDPGNVLVSNNIAVCLLYLGRLRDALEVAEAAIEANPAQALHESVLLNVCTLYELRSACRARSKVAMLKLLATHKESADGREKLRSLHSEHKAYVRFRNITVRKVDVIWLNYEGSQVKYRTLKPGEFFDVNTFLSHPWLFRDSETQDKLVVRCKEIFRPPVPIDQGAGGANQNRRVTRTEVCITIPVYSLKERAMQVICSYISQPEDVFQLDLPDTLRSELMYKIRILRRT
ncbi:hypothetical protein J437_LFUL012646 [Ladona fulva]|uniref:von Hippel-Lindau disease tumour suppressor beta domain-containing protein n=1 Tax=Ladona fulva TaxID=123851 RepID=A0A8K0KE85_LADFU|nr:hypothetical protein J437_LFUL012646 [Ladona fulva]